MKSNSDLLRLAEIAKDNHSDSTLIYLGQITQAKPEDLFDAAVIGGRFLRNKRQYAEAISKFQEAQVLSEEINSVINDAILEDDIAEVYGLQGKFDEAFALKESALETFRALNDSTGISKCMLGISRLFTSRYDYKEAQKYIGDAIKFANTKRDKALAFAGYGIHFKHQNEFDSARYYYEKGLSMYDEEPRFLVRSYYNLALLEKRLKKIPEALAYYKKAIDLSREIGDDVGVAIMEVNKTYIYYDLKEYEKADKVLNEYAASIEVHGSIQNKLDFWLIRYNISEKLDKASDALSHYRSFRKITDSLDNVELNTKIIEFETKYETAEKEKLIVLQDQKLDRASNQRKLLLGGLAGVIWLGLFGVLYYWSRNKFNKKLAAQEIENLQQEKKLMAVSSMIEGQEVERSRIAQDLHDSIGGLLTTVKAHFGVIQKEIDKIAALDLGKKVEHLIDEAALEVRRISHKMSPRSLQLNGLCAALNDAANELDAAGSLSVAYEWNGEEVNLKEGEEIMIYRIFQELLANIMKHAKASEVFVQVNVFDGNFNIMVEDNGIGFDTELAHSSGGLGLDGITSRVEYLKGTFAVDSTIGKGTTVNIHFPI